MWNATDLNSQHSIGFYSILNSFVFDECHISNERLQVFAYKQHCYRYVCWFEIRIDVIACDTTQQGISLDHLVVADVTQLFTSQDFQNFGSSSNTLIILSARNILSCLTRERIKYKTSTKYIQQSKNRKYIHVVTLCIF